MKILGIHGRSSRPHRPGGSWSVRIDDLKSRGYNIDLPQFDPCEDPTYESWEKDLKSMDIESYDVVITSSHGSGVFARFIKENNLHMKRVIFCCPGRGSTGRDNTGKLYDWLEDNEMSLEKHIDEFFIVHSKDDATVLYSEGIKFQKQIGGKLISLQGLPHSLNGEGVIVINNLATLGRIHKK